MPLSGQSAVPWPLQPRDTTVHWSGPLVSPRNRSGCRGSCQFCCIPHWQVSFSWAELRLLIIARGLFPQVRAGSSPVEEENQRAGPCVQAKPCPILTLSDRPSVTFFQSPAKGGGGTASAPSPLSAGSQGHDWFGLSRHFLLSCPSSHPPRPGRPLPKAQLCGPSPVSRKQGAWATLGPVSWSLRVIYVSTVLLCSL